MLIILEMRASARCDACSVLTPLPGVRNELSCRNCAATMDLAGRAAKNRTGGLRYPFGGYYDNLAEAALLLDAGDECRDARDSHGFPVALKRVAAPSCASCNTEIPIPKPGETDINCPGCNDRIAIRWPDDETKTWDPRIMCVINDGKGRGTGVPKMKKHGAAVWCDGCGAPVTEVDLDDHRRSRKCDHCGAINFIPDGAWLALFPQPEWHRCYLGYDVDRRQLVALHKTLIHEDYLLPGEVKSGVREKLVSAWEAARDEVFLALRRGEASAYELELLAFESELSEEDAALVDTGLDDDARKRIGSGASGNLALRWAASKEAPLRRVAAEHPITKIDVLEKLAIDEDCEVRAAVAAHPNTSATLLAQLRKDKDRGVVDAVKANPQYKPKMLERFFG